MNALQLISRSKSTPYDNARVALNFLLGVGLASLASFVNTEDGMLYAQGVWILPTVAFAFVLGELAPMNREPLF